MKRFDQRDVREALEHAADGGQALHTMGGGFAFARSDTPGCFKGRTIIAHLFDQSKDRLIATAKRLGVRRIKVEREGASGQHIDLCGKPLDRALAECEFTPPANLVLFPNTEASDAK